MLLAGYKISHHIASLGLLITLSFTPGRLCSQNVTQPSRKAAYEALDRGDYDRAYREFTILLGNYPRDPIYKYYCGVTLVKSGKEPEKATEFIREALESQQDIRPIPEDAWFYLARSQQMAGKYKDALQSYAEFEKKAGKKAARDLKVQDFIRECNEGKGKIKDQVYAEVMEQATGKEEKADEPLPRTPDTAITRKLLPASDATKKKPVPDNYDRELTAAMDYQVKADSLNAIAAGYRQEYEKLPAAQKQAVKARIDETEALSAKYQKMADNKFGQSDTITKTKKADIPELKSEPRQMTDIFSIFAVAPDPLLLKDQKVEIDPKLPAGLIYRIQIGVYSKPLTLSYFKGVIPVMGFKIPGSSSVRYFAGMFRKAADAGKALLKVRQAGLRDAFVVAVADGKAISLERAALMEKEWGLKPFLTVIDASDGKPAAGVTPTLVFRVELMKTLIPVNEETAQSIRNLANNRGLEILLKGDGSFVYLIGKFITFESAEEYASLLKRNGYNDARVAAYLGEKEIPVEKAKLLFEKVE